MEVANLINLYKKDETTFEHNGLGSLDKNILNPEISWKDNGAFTLEFKYPLFAKHGFEIENSSIVRANDPEGSNLFFVYKITPSMGYVTVLCYQISYKLAFNSINDTNIVNKNGQNALNQMSSATQYPHGFTFNSDISTTATSRVVRKNPIEFLLDTGLDNSFINRWGGHIVRHNFNISMNSAYGSNKGYTIRHRKDLTGYEAGFDESTVITRIRPVGYDGLLLPEIYVDSPLINTYTEPRIQQFEYSDVKVKQKDDDDGFATKEQAYAELRRLAQLEFSKNKVDKPDFSAKVEFVNLKETQEYQDLRSLKQLLPGDVVKVIHADDNFNIEAQIVEYKWNPLNNSYISITLGNYTKSFTSTVSKASSLQTSLQTNLSQIAQTAQSAWTAANGKNTVYSLSSFPAITSSSAEGDLLYLKNGDKIEMWILEKVDGKLQWVLQVSDATQEELKAQIKDAQLDIADAVKSANDAVNKANQNIKEIGELDVKLIDTKELTDKAQKDATKAINDAKTAYNQATENTGKIVTVNQEIDKIKGEITTKVSQIDFDKSVNRITQAESSITQNANAITQKVSKTDVENILTGKAYATKSELTQTSDSLTSTISGVKLEVDKKASQTQVTQLSQNLDGFKTTVSSTYLSKNDASNLYPTKTTVATQISQSATDITSSVQSWTNGRLNGYSTIKQTDDSITSAVSGKADRSQVTQLSDQITSVVSSAAQNNLVYNATLQSSDGWLLQNGYTQSSARNLNGNYIINFSLSSNSNNTWYFARSKQVSIGIWKEYAYAASFMRRSDISNGGTFMFGVEGFDANGSRVEFKTTNIHSQLTDEKWTTISDMYEFKNSSVKTVCFTLATNSFGHYIACQPIMVNSGSVGNFVADGMDKSQITQLSDQIVSKVSLGEMNSQITQLKNDINLRIVEKGTVTSQINLESGKALISANQILLNADNVKFSGSAFIPNSVIQNLSADKITAGTINAATVNVINLNVDSLVGNKTNFIQSNWNGIYNGVQIDGTGIHLGFAGNRNIDLDGTGFNISNSGSVISTIKNWSEMSTWMINGNNKILFAYSVSEGSYNDILSIDKNGIDMRGSNIIGLRGISGKWESGGYYPTFKSTSVTYQGKKLVGWATDNNKVGIMFSDTDVYFYINGLIRKASFN